LVPGTKPPVDNLNSSSMTSSSSPTPTNDDDEIAGYSKRRREAAAVAALEARYGVTPPLGHPDHARVDVGAVCFNHLLLLPSYPSIYALAGCGPCDLSIGPALLRRAGQCHPASTTLKAVEEEYWCILAQGDLGTWRSHQRGDSWCGRDDQSYHRMPEPLGKPKQFIQQCHQLAADVAARADAAWDSANLNPNATDDTLRPAIAAMAHQIAADTSELDLEALYRYHLAVIVTRIRWTAAPELDGSPRQETRQPALAL